MQFKRYLKPPQQSFFLFGPRGVGKSTWLKRQFPDVPRIDLLESRVYLKLQRDPQALEEILGPLPPKAWVVIDEVQRIPELLNEVHRLIEKRRWRFALSGSSARKLKRGAGNLLGGRALTLAMESLCSGEMGQAFQIEKVVQWGALPLVSSHYDSAADVLSAYVHTYLREEIREEGLVRKLDPFVRFLEVAGLMNGQILNLQNIAREAHVPRSSLDVYFQILEDTLIGHRLPAYRPGLRVREVGHPKFYFFDPGVARAAAGLLYDPIDSIYEGFALETWIYHEIRAYNSVQKKGRPLFYFRTGSGAEIDFVIETRKKTLSTKPEIITIEVKRSKKWDPRWEQPARQLANAKQISVNKMLGIYCGERDWTHEGFRTMPIHAFLKDLWAGKFF